jgi:hypothetical protein
MLIKGKKYFIINFGKYYLYYDLMRCKMIRVNQPIRVMWILSGVNALICGLSAVINPKIYNGFVADKYIYGTIAQDVMAIIASVILVAIAFKMSDRSYIAQTVGMGLMGFFFYAYGV